MKNYTYLLLVILLTFSSTSCNTANDKLNPCEKTVIINNDIFNNTNSDNYAILNASIIGDCLEIKISSGGCDGNTWIIELIDADRISETAVVQRDIKLSLQNTEICNTIVTQIISFNIKPLQTDANEITLNLENWNNQLQYRY